MSVDIFSGETRLLFQDAELLSLHQEKGTRALHSLAPGDKMQQKKGKIDTKVDSFLHRRRSDEASLLGG